MMIAFGSVLVAQRLDVDVLTANAVGAGLTVPVTVLLYEHAPFVSVMVIEPVPAVFHVTAIVASFVLFVVTECVPPEMVYARVDPLIRPVNE